MATGFPRCAILNITEYGSSEAGSADVLGGELPEASSSVHIGIVMGLLASIAINVGQNLQAIGLQGPTSEAAKVNPCKSGTWVCGMTIFIAGSMLNFAAFSFASSSILVPLEAVQLVVNVTRAQFKPAASLPLPPPQLEALCTIPFRSAWCLLSAFEFRCRQVVFNKVFNNAPVSLRMLSGVALAITGTTLAVVFGPNDERCFSVPDMQKFWYRPAWYVYLAFSLALAAFCFATYSRYRRALQRRCPLPHSQYMLPVTFALSSALVGGAQMVVHSKAVAELLEIVFLKASDPSLDEPYPMTTWYFYVEFAILSVCGVIWLYRMNESLALFDPLFIIPLMQSSYILFGVIGGGIYFNEFGSLSNKEMFGVRLGVGGWILFGLALLFILCGLFLIAPQPLSDTDRTDASPRLTRIPSAYASAYMDAFLAMAGDEADPELLSPLSRDASYTLAAGAYGKNSDELVRQPSAFSQAYNSMFALSRSASGTTSSRSLSGMSFET